MHSNSYIQLQLDRIVVHLLSMHVRRKGMFRRLEAELHGIMCVGLAFAAKDRSMTLGMPEERLHGESELIESQCSMASGASRTLELLPVCVSQEPTMAIPTFGFGYR